MHAKMVMLSLRTLSQPLKKLKELYSKGIKIIQNEFNLSELSQKIYTEYKTYGWQVTTGSDEEKEQSRFVLNINENS